MKRLLIHAYIALMVLFNVAACGSKTETTKPSVESAKPALPTDKASLKPPSFGISEGAGVHEYKIGPGKDLKIRGWWIADEQIAVSYDFNGERATPGTEKRDDVRKKFSNFKYTDGFVISVPKAKLKPENKLDIYLGNKNVWTMTVRIQ